MFMCDIHDQKKQYLIGKYITIVLHDMGMSVITEYDTNTSKVTLQFMVGLQCPSDIAKLAALSME